MIDNYVAALQPLETTLAHIKNQKYPTEPQCSVTRMFLFHHKK